MPQYNQIFTPIGTSPAAQEAARSRTVLARATRLTTTGALLESQRDWSFRQALQANLAAGLAALGLTTGCVAPPSAPRPPMGTNVAAIQRDGQRLLGHLSPVEDDAQPTGVVASNRNSKGHEQ